MKFTTIWTIPAMTLSERLRRTRDWSAMKAASMLPLRVRFWTTIGEIGKATMHSNDVPATPLCEVLNGLDVPKSMS